MRIIYVKVRRFITQKKENDQHVTLKIRQRYSDFKTSNNTWYFSVCQRSVSETSRCLKQMILNCFFKVIVDGIKLQLVEIGCQILTKFCLLQGHTSMSSKTMFLNIRWELSYLRHYTNKKLKFKTSLIHKSVYEQLRFNVDLRFPALKLKIMAFLSGRLYHFFID